MVWGAIPHGWQWLQVGGSFSTVPFNTVPISLGHLTLKRKDILNINYVRALLSGRTPYSMGRSAEKAVQS